MLQPNSEAIAAFIGFRRPMPFATTPLGNEMTQWHVTLFAVRWTEYSIRIQRPDPTDRVGAFSRAGGLRMWRPWLMCLQGSHTAVAGTGSAPLPRTSFKGRVPASAAQNTSFESKLGQGRGSQLEIVRQQTAHVVSLLDRLYVHNP